MSTSLVSRFVNELTISEFVNTEVAASKSRASVIAIKVAPTDVTATALEIHVSGCELKPRLLDTWTPQLMRVYKLLIALRSRQSHGLLADLWNYRPVACCCTELGIIVNDHLEVTFSQRVIPNCTAPRPVAMMAVSALAGWLMAVEGIPDALLVKQFDNLLDGHLKLARAGAANAALSEPFCTMPAFSPTPDRQG